MKEPEARIPINAVSGLVESFMRRIDVYAGQPPSTMIMHPLTLKKLNPEIYDFFVWQQGQWSRRMPTTTLKALRRSWRES